MNVKIGDRVKIDPSIFKKNGIPKHNRGHVRAACGADNTCLVELVGSTYNPATKQVEEAVRSGLWLGWVNAGLLEKITPPTEEVHT